MRFTRAFVKPSAAVTVGVAALLVAVALTPSPAGGVAVLTARPAPVFATPIELAPPSDGVAGPYNTYLNGVSCTSAGNCVAVGQYTDTAGGSPPMIITETGGVWGPAVRVALPADVITDPAALFSFLFDVDCTSAGNCTAVGAYTDNDGNSEPMVVTETAGVWGAGVALSLPANAMTAPGSQYAWLNQLDCPAPGGCVATGGYAATGSSMSSGGVIFSETGGVWAQGIQVVLPPNATPATSGPKNPAAGTVSMGGVSCLGVGQCVAEGAYTDTNFNSQPMISTETNGSWSPAIELITPGNAATAVTAQNAFMANLVCFSAGNCEAGGGYNDLHGNAQPVYYQQTDGVWRQGVELTLPANAATGAGEQSAYLNNFECTSPGNCAAVAAYNDTSGGGQPLAITETGGAWARGTEPPLPSNAAPTAGNQDANIYGLSCTSPGVCVAVGNYVDSDGNLQAMAYTTVPTLAITTTSLPAAKVGTRYSAVLAATGGTRPHTWAITAGSLPSGLSLDAATGAITGSPTASGTFHFTVTVRDTSPPQEASAALRITIEPAVETTTPAGSVTTAAATPVAGTPALTG